MSHHGPAEARSDATALRAEKRVDRLEEEVDRLTTLNGHLRDEVTRLRARVIASASGEVSICRRCADEITNPPARRADAQGDHGEANEGARPPEGGEQP